MKNIIYLQRIIVTFILKDFRRQQIIQFNARSKKLSQGVPAGMPGRRSKPGVGGRAPGSGSRWSGQSGSGWESSGSVFRASPISARFLENYFFNRYTTETKSSLHNLMSLWGTFCSAHLLQWFFSMQSFLWQPQFSRNCYDQNISSERRLICFARLWFEVFKPYNCFF